MSALDFSLSPEDAKALAAALMDRDPTDGGVVTEADFRSVLRRFLGFGLSEHQVFLNIFLGVGKRGRLEIIFSISDHHTVQAIPPAEEREDGGDFGAKAVIALFPYLK